MSRDTHLLAAARHLAALGRLSSALDLLAAGRAQGGGPALGHLAAFLTNPPGIAVILPYGPGIEKTIASLVRQSLAGDLFDILIPFPAKDDSAAAALAALQSAHPTRTLHLFAIETPGFAAACNGALWAARRQFLIFLSPGDQLSTGFLEAGYQQAGEKVVVSFPAPTPSKHRAPRQAPGVVLALCPVWLRDKAAFNADLGRAAPLGFWADVLAALPREAVRAAQGEGLAWQSAPLPERTQITEFRAALVDQLQRLTPQGEGFAIPAQTAAPTQKPTPAQTFLDQLWQACLGPYISVLRQEPEQWEGFRKIVESQSAKTDALALIAPHLPKRLVLSYCFPPYADTAGIVMAKRIAEWKEPVDVMSNRMDRVRGEDPGLQALYRPYLGRHVIQSAGQSFTKPEAVQSFAEASAETFRQGNYSQRITELYSRAMWPASHFAAALIKLDHPKLHWTAEFSDPIALDLDGEIRSYPAPMDWLKRRGLWAKVRDSLPEIAAPDLLFSYAELLPYAMADRLVFTNENQRRYMLEHPWISPIADRLLEKSSLARQPTLPAPYYAMGKTLPYLLDPAKWHIGYFGRFYRTRGLTEVAEALSRLPMALRDRIVLHVHSPQPPEVEALAREFGLEAQIIAHPLLPYLDFLAALSAFDLLLVNDAQTAGKKSCNPYLPSKLSDYLGAGRPIWALAEAGSILEATKLPAGSVRTALGDVAGCTQTLAQLAEERRAISGAEPA